MQLQQRPAVAVVGASGNFGRFIVASLTSSEGFNVTAITRKTSSAEFPPETAVVRVDYSLAELIRAFEGQDAVVCVLGPAGVALNTVVTQAAHDAGVKRLIINDFGWGPDFRNLPEFDAIGATRKVAWRLAADLASTNTGFTWTGITVGIPIDWALQRFATLGFDMVNRVATVYDSGTQEWCGTTRGDIGGAVVRVLLKLDATANRFVKVRSIQTSQLAMLDAFQEVTGVDWTVEHATTAGLISRGRQKLAAGEGGWILDLMVGQIFEEGANRGLLPVNDANLLGLSQISAHDLARLVLSQST